MNTILNNYIDEIKDKIINSTCELINIPSVLNTKDGSNTPFGFNSVRALEYILNLGKSFGFRTKNIDNMCGYIEFGEGEKMLGIIGHLDVVPADSGWTFDPFNATISDNKIYGRGAIDDKGPTVATLYAMKVVSENYKLNKRVRLIVGLNEEFGWECIKRYKQTEEIPTIAFSPDANFPCIYAEKTVESIYLKQTYIKNFSLYIENLSTNQNAINVVPKYCEANIGFNPKVIQNISSTVHSIIDQYSYSSIKVENVDSAHIRLLSFGTAAHSAHPELGDNAISKLVIVLNELFHFYHINIELLDYFASYIGDDFSGKKLGINYEDESGKLTLNTAQFFLEKNKLQIGLNLRIPVTVDSSVVSEIFQKNDSQIEVEIAATNKSLYISKDNFLVKKLCNIFNDYNNSNFEPVAIGGATYARAFDNCISFGPQMPGDRDMCHQVDEYISIENLLFCAKVYAEAILKL